MNIIDIISIIIFLYLLLLAFRHAHFFRGGNEKILPVIDARLIGKTTKKYIIFRTSGLDKTINAFSMFNNYIKNNKSLKVQDTTDKKIYNINIKGIRVTNDSFINKTNYIQIHPYMSFNDIKKIYKTDKSVYLIVLSL